MNNNTLIIAYAIFGAVLVIAFTVITLLYSGDQALALAGLTGFAVMGFSNLAGLKVSLDNGKKADQLTQRVNGRLTELLAAIKEQAVTQQRLAAAQSLAHGITIGRGQVGADPVDPPLLPDMPPGPGDQH